MEPVKVSAARKKITVKLPSFDGGLAVFSRALSVEDKIEFQKVLDQTAEGNGVERFKSMVDLIVRCFLEWNLVDDAGTPIPFTPDMIGKTCSELDVMAMLQAITGRQMLDDTGTRPLTQEEVAKKGLSA